MEAHPLAHEAPLDSGDAVLSTGGLVFPTERSLLGSWFYGSSGFRFDISELESGQLFFEDRQGSLARTSGVLRAEDGWFVADINLSNGQHYGMVRLHLRDTGGMAIVANFKRLDKPKWGKDILAYRGQSASTRDSSWALPTLPEREDEAVVQAASLGERVEDITALFGERGLGGEDLTRPQQDALRVMEVDRVEMTSLRSDNEALRLRWEKARSQLEESESLRKQLVERLGKAALRVQELEAELYLASAMKEEMEIQRDLAMAPTVTPP